MKLSAQKHLTEVEFKNKKSRHRSSLEVPEEGTNREGKNMSIVILVFQLTVSFPFLKTCICSSHILQVLTQFLIALRYSAI